MYVCINEGVYIYICIYIQTYRDTDITVLNASIPWEAVAEAISSSCPEARAWLDAMVA